MTFATLAAFYFVVFVSVTQPAHAAKAALKQATKPPAPATVSEMKLWRTDSGLQALAKKINPLKSTPGDGALGLNAKFPARVLVTHQSEGWNWIRSGVALGNGFIVDRGIMAFEWAFARMQDDGSFGESKTVEISHFLGLYARSILLLRTSGMEERVKRLERLTPRLELSLRSDRSLTGERRWDAVEQKSWNTTQRIQAAAAAYWIGRLLVNPNLRKTADIWLNESIKRQDENGLFPSSLPEKSKTAMRAQLEALDALQGLAMADGIYANTLREPIRQGFRLVEKNKAAGTAPITVATYAAWSKDPAAIASTRQNLKR